MKTLFFGDLSPTVITEPYFEKGDMDALFKDTLSLFEGNDINFVNVECAITDAEASIEKFGPALKTGRNTASCLKKLGVNVAGLSNNHIFDFGKAGALDTIKALGEEGIPYTGFGNDYEDSRRNYIFEKDGEKIAIVAVCEHEYSYAIDDRMGARPFDEFDTIIDIRRAKATADRVIVVYHGGKEHCRYPSPRLRRACRAMVEAGADVVLCQHSHCIGCYEEFNGAHILYGQGNFHFVVPADKCPETWNGSLAVHYDTKSNEIAFTPILNTDTGIRLALGSEYDDMTSAFKARSLELADGGWILGWREFCDRFTRQYYNATQSAYGKQADEIGSTIFAHYIDCEAHRDVWMELFKTANHKNEK